MELKIDRYIKNQNVRIENNKNYQFKFIYTDENEHIVDIYFREKIVLRAKYEILGCYNVINSIWIWSWAISEIEKNLAENCKYATKKYYDKLSKNKITKEKEEYLYYLSNPSFFISYKNLDKLLKFGTYITKSIFILPHKINENSPKMIEFILIKKVIQEHNI